MHSTNRLSLGFQLLLEFLKFNLILSEQSTLVYILIDARFILNFLRASCKLKRLVTFTVGLESWRDHSNHGCLTVSAE